MYIRAPRYFDALRGHYRASDSNEPGATRFSLLYPLANSLSPSLSLYVLVPLHAALSIPASPLQGLALRSPPLARSSGPLTRSPPRPSPYTRCLEERCKAID